jgi:hypothetical protein
MRKRSVFVLLVGVLVAGVAWSQMAEAKGPGRVENASYATPAIGVAGNGGGACSSQNGYGCVELFTTKTDKHVTISITDQSGVPVYATWGQETAPAGGYQPQQITTKGDFCGKTPKPVTITGGQRLVVYIWEGAGPSGCAGVATQGRVRATFSS